MSQYKTLLQFTRGTAHIHPNLLC